MTMSDARQHGESLDYVRDVVEGAGERPAPRSIWYLWAGVALVGFPLADVKPEWMAPFWAVAGPVGFLLSMWLGGRGARSAGVESRRDTRRHALHWGGLLLAILMLVPLAATGGLAQAAFGQAILVILALGYFMAGVHFARAYLWIALLVAAGYGLTFTLDAWAWTMAGALVALGMVATAHAGAGRRA